MSAKTDALQNPIVIAGGLLTTVSGLTFVFLVGCELAGIYAHAYDGLVVYVIVPAFFLLGLLLILLGYRVSRRARAAGASEEDEWLVIDFGDPRIRRRTLVIAALTLVNIAIVLVSVMGATHWMESPGFCGQACHRPMQPQFTAWQGAPHAEVPCTDCHVGEGARALVRSKLAGVRQLYHVVTNQVPTPIPPGAHNMRPASETCGKCHWSGRNSGELVAIKRAYADDEANSENLTILRMQVGGPGSPTASGRAIHWHASPDARIAFLESDARQPTISYVRAVDKNGEVREYRVKGAPETPIAPGALRVMDCIDCHNTPSHRIAATAEDAVDEAIGAGRIPRTLPFIRREAVKLAKAEYATPEEASQHIDAGLRAFYRTVTDEGQLTRAIASVQAVYRRNVFPSMKVTYGVYPTHLGHTTSNGCFRCHDGEHVAADGATISADCEYCHIQVEANTATR